MEKDFFNEFVKCDQFNSLSKTLIAFFTIYVVLLLILDIVTLNKSKSRYKKLYADKDFFSTLNIL